MHLNNHNIRKSTILLVLLLVFGQLSSQAQPGFIFRCNKDTLLACGTNSFVFKARVPNIHASTDDYVINPLSANSCYNPYVESNTPGTPITINEDDRFTRVIDLPFPFKFYDSTYDKLVVSTNGYICFDISRARQTSHFGILNNGGFLSATTGTPQNLPSTLYDRAIIMGPYHDLNPNSVSTSPSLQTKYEIVGTAPHRKFVLSFFKVPLFNCTSLINNTHQIVLYEETGIIEVFIASKETCPGWNQGRSMIGIQNYDRDKGMVAPGRGAADPAWSGAALDESWRFVPVNGPSMYRGAQLLTLLGTFASVAGPTDTFSLPNGDLGINFQNVVFSTPPSATPVLLRDTFVVKSRYESINNPGTFIFGYDTVVAVRLASATAGNIIGPASICTGTTPTYSSRIGDGTWSVNNANATIDPITGVLTPVTAGPVTITYTVPASGTCPSDFTTLNINILSSIPAAILTGPATGTLCRGGTAVIATNTPGGTWSTSNPSIATVSNAGNVRGVAGGNVIIRYTLPGTGGCTSVVTELPLTITIPPNITITNNGNSSLCPTFTTTLTPNLPGGIWTNNRPTVASIDAATGVVTALSSGTATFTYSIPQPGVGCDQATRSITITVINQSNAGVISTNGSRNLWVGDMTNVSSSGNAGGVWASSNPAVASINANGFITALSAGQTTISYSVTGSSCPATSSTLNLTVNPAPSPGSFTFSCNKDTLLPTCNNPCLTLKAIIPNIHLGTDEYVINPLSAGNCYVPYIPSNRPGDTVRIEQDDRYSRIITLPFPFKFYGITYRHIVLSTNGYISFDTSRANLFSHYSILRSGGALSSTTGNGENLPSTLYDRGLIMGPYHDIDPGETTSPTQQIKYDVVGVAPNRRFIFSFYKVPLYNCPSLINNDHQIVLYEGLGIIEVFVSSKQVCSTWNRGRAMIGLQNFARNKGIMAPGRRASDPSWAITPATAESWRFVPADGPSAFRGIELRDIQGNLVPTTGFDTASLPNGDMSVSFYNVCLTNATSDTTKFIIKPKYESLMDPTQFVYGTDTLRVITKVVKLVNTSITNVKCKGESTGVISLTGSGGAVGATYTYVMNNGTPQTSGLFSNLPAGTYNIRITDGSGQACPRDTTIIITEPAVSLDVNIIQPALYVPSIQEIQLNSSNTGTNPTLQWTSVPMDPTMSDPTLADIIATPSVNTMYYLQATDALGCTDKDSALVTIINTCLNVRNAFTPNGDGINDLWKVYDRRDCVADRLIVRVFNRHGSKVYESQDYWNTWDGTYRGSSLPDGTYYVVVEFSLPNGQRVVKRSDLNIIR